MRKVGRLNERELTKLVRQVLSESDFSVEPHVPTQPREKDVRGVFGKKYGAYIPIDVIRYMRKSPARIFAKLYEIYGDKAYEYLDKASGKSNTDIDDAEGDYEA